MLKYIFSSILLVAILISSCSKEVTLSTPQNPIVDTEEPTVKTGDENYLNKKSDYIFDQDKLHTFELTLSKSALAEIDADPAAEEYVEGSLSFEGETVEKVGIRYKGSIGAFVGCLTGRDWANPSGSKTCTKLSMKIKMNWENSDDRFFGLKKLQFHSQNLDNSQMRERLGYWLFREMGVPAPRSVHARLMINGVFYGVYALTEQIDGRFTRFNFEDGSGNLYKEIWPLNSNGQAHSESAYIKELKTNEDEDPSAEMIRTFAEEIASATENELKAVIEKWMDIDEVLSYIAVDRIIRNDDGAFHWYCNGGDCEPHNFYWYEEPTENTVHLIPWDLDNAFENIAYNANPVTPIVDAWGEISNDCQPFRSGIFGMQRSAACDKLTGAWVSYDTEYTTKLKDFKSGVFSQSVVNDLLDKWSDQIKNGIQEASQSHDDANSVTIWENAVNRLKQDLDFARN